MKKLMLLYTLLCGASLAAFAEDVPGLSLLNAFSSQCKTQGEWVQGALSDSLALMNTLKAISNDPDCKSVAGALSDLHGLQTTIQNYQTLSQNQIQIAALEAKEQELLNQLAATSNPATIAEINTSLRSILAEKAALIGKASAENQAKKPVYANVLNQLVVQTNSALKQVVANQACLLKRPSAISSAFSLGSVVGAQALTSYPALGLGLSASSELMGVVIEMANRMKLNKQLKKVSASTVALSAYKCALETMGKRWCRMQDAEKFIDLKIRLQNQAKQSELISALTLNDREIPVILAWLDGIRSGVAPSGTADARRLQTTLFRETTVRATVARAQGLFAQNRPVFDQSQSAEDKWTVIRSNIISLLELGNMDSESNNNPFYEIFSKERGAYFLIGLNSIPNRQGSSIPFIEFNPFSPDDFPEGGFVPDYDKLASQFNLWSDRARERVKKELALVLQPDGLGTVISAFDQTDGRIKVSPRTALTKLIDFLKDHTPKKWTGGAFKRIYENQIARMEKIVGYVDEVANDDNADPKKALEGIFTEAELQFGNTVFKTRLEFVVRLAVQEAIENSEIKDQNIVAQFMAADRFTDVLVKFGGADNLTLVMADIKSARPVVLANLTNFANLFGKNMKMSLENLVKEQKKADASIASDYFHSRAELCFGLLAVPKWPDSISKDYCRNVYANPLLPGAPRSKVITDAVMDGPITIALVFTATS